LLIKTQDCYNRVQATMGQPQAEIAVIKPIKIKPGDIDPLSSGGQDDAQPPTASRIPGMNCIRTGDIANRDARLTASSHRQACLFQHVLYAKARFDD
jgi:hypothetical protein